MKVGIVMNEKNALTILKEAGIKPTSQRALILDYLRNNKTHPSTEEIYQDLQKEVAVLSRATVYNTVNIFREKGILRILDLGDDVAHYDIDPEDHAHFQCTSCNRIWNIQYEDLPELGTPKGFKVEDIQLIMRGKCAECQSRMA